MSFIINKNFVCSKKSFNKTKNLLIFLRLFQNINLSTASSLLRKQTFTSNSNKKSYRNKDSYSFVVIGGGSGGISVAARLSRLGDKQSIALIEPSEVIRLKNHNLKTLYYFFFSSLPISIIIINHYGH